MDRLHDRSYLTLLYDAAVIPPVQAQTRLAEDLRLEPASIRLLQAYIKERYAKDSRVEPHFATIGDIDAYIYYEYYCSKCKYY